MARSPRTWVVIAGFLLGVAGCGASPEATCRPLEQTTCYPGPSGTLAVGRCVAGTLSCSSTGKPGACTGALLPEAEVCNGEDDDCDGLTDEDVTNACGGCTQLEHQPSERCLPCGRWECAGREAVQCRGQAANNCGQCNAPDVPGLNASCVAASGCSGTTACPADGGLVATCVGAPKNNCGVCDRPDVTALGLACQTGGCEGTLQCASSGTATLCAGPNRNSCLWRCRRARAGRPLSALDTPRLRGAGVLADWPVCRVRAFPGRPRQRRRRQPLRRLPHQEQP